MGKRHKPEEIIGKLREAEKAATETNTAAESPTQNQRKVTMHDTLKRIWNEAPMAISRSFINVATQPVIVIGNPVQFGSCGVGQGRVFKRSSVSVGRVVAPAV